jgi:hypothetical protein
MGIVFGVILIVFFKEQKITIIDYPKPFDTKKYIDTNGAQFQYVTKEVDCDKNEKSLRSYPIQ